MVAAAAEPQNVRHHRPIFSGLGIVVIAVEQHRIHGVADLALRRFHEAHAQILGRKIHAIEVARDAALRRQHHDGRGVRILIALGIVLILKADGFG